MDHNYHLGLLCLTHLLISADGIVVENELDAIATIRGREKISNAAFYLFQQLIKQKSEREIFEAGIELVNRCTYEERLNTFVMLYKLSEVDGRVHVKEIRFLLYSIKSAGVDFDDVVAKAMETESLL